MNLSLAPILTRCVVGRLKSSPLLISAAATLLAGCTQVTSKPIGDDATSIKGLTYCLPKPVIRVVPQGDGTIDVGIEYLPDSEHMYWLSTDSYISSHKAQVLRDEGMLTKFQWSSNSVGVASDLVKAAGEVTKSVVDAHLKAETDAITGLKTYDEAVLDAQQTVALDNLAVEEAADDPAKRIIAQKKLDEDKIKLETAKARRDAEKLRQAEKPIVPAAVSLGDVTPSGIGGTLVDSPTPGKTAHTQYTISGGVQHPQSVWGPVLFSIDERVVRQGNVTRPTVVLRALRSNVNPWLDSQSSEFQQIFETNAPPTSRPSDGGQDIIAPKTVNIISGNSQEVVLTTAKPVVSVGLIQVKKGEEVVKTPAPTVTVESSTELKLKMNGFPPGQYTVKFQLYAQDRTPLGTAELTVIIVAH